MVARRVTLLVAFGFLPKKILEAVGSYECYFVTL